MSDDALSGSEGMADGDGLACPSTSPPPSPFLALPPELRLLIYRHLIPNRPVLMLSLDGDSHTELLRDDGEACHPALLRVCRLIYNELLPEWYDWVGCSALIDGGGLRVLDVDVLPGSAAAASTSALRHPGLSFMKWIYLQVMLPVLPPPELRGSKKPDDTTSRLDPHGGVISLVEYLTGGQFRFEELDLEFAVSDLSFISFDDRPVVLRRVLEAIFLPLRTLSRLRRCTLHLIYHPHLEQSSATDSQSLARHEFTRIVDDVWSPVAEEMIRSDQPDKWPLMRPTLAAQDHHPVASSMTSGFEMDEEKEGLFRLGFCSSWTVMDKKE